ncbi:MAG: hypothetical protein LBQ13_04700 [Endomicrobium sp.]|jgi:uncharacterized membrane-anchored protein YjiN (DUF445 family)|nr:hypothetical protein [Endomicrobium sp.]
MSKNKVNEAKIIYLRDVSEEQYSCLERIKDKYNITTITGAVRFIIDNFEDIFSKMERADKLNKQLKKELQESRGELEQVKEAWKTLNKLLKC